MLDAARGGWFLGRAVSGFSEKAAFTAFLRALMRDLTRAQTLSEKGLE